MEQEKDTRNILNKRIVIEYPITKHKEIKTAASFLGLSIKDFVDLCIKEKIDREKKRGNIY